MTEDDEGAVHGVHAIFGGAPGNASNGPGREKRKRFIPSLPNLGRPFDANHSQLFTSTAVAAMTRKCVLSDVGNRG